jgi:hypothetical protein
MKRELKMKKRIFKLCMLACLLASCSGQVNSSTSYANSENSASISSTASSSFSIKRKVNAEIYSNELINPTVAVTFFTFDEDVPYLELSDFLTNFLSHIYPQYSISGNVITNTDTGIGITFDSKENKINTDDLDQLRNTSEFTEVSVDIMDVFDDNHGKYSAKDSSYTKGNAISIDMNKYKTKIISYEGKTYVPFAYLDNIFFSSCGVRYAFNGNGFYPANYVNQGGVTTDGQLTDMGTAYFSGSYANMKERSDSYIDYCYYSFLFNMEYNNGKFPGLNISDLDAKLDSYSLKYELRSKNSVIADNAIASTLFTLFYDGGHTRFSNLGVTAGYNSENNKTASELVGKLDERYRKLIKTHQELSEKRGELNQKLTIQGQTAILRFDEFVTKDGEETTETTFDLFKESFETIKQNSAIKNVVFDVTLNGGGAASALGHAISFLTDDPLKLRVKNPVTGAVSQEAIKYDNDEDGDFDDNDSYQEKYNFYILTSNFSFSCANAFPIYCQDHNLAKVIGMRSGGGDCSVQNSTSADGTCWNMSSTNMLTRKDGTSYDDGAKLDYELDESYFYDAEKLNNYLAGLN